MPDALTFNARNVEPAKPRENELIPNGWYRAWIIESEIKPNSKGTGRNLELTWEIIEGPHAKRRIWDRLSIENPSKTAQDIAQEALSAICHATGVLEMEHTGQLHGEVCSIKVGIEKGKNDFPDKNRIFGYVADGHAPASATPKVGAGARGAVAGERHPALSDADDSELPF